MVVQIKPLGALLTNKDGRDNVMLSSYRWINHNIITLSDAQSHKVLSRVEIIECRPQLMKVIHLI